MQYKVLPHAAIVISIMYFVFFFIDKVNQPMAFINNDITKGLLFVLCVISILNAISLIRVDRQRERRQSGSDRQSAYDRRSGSDRQSAYDRRSGSDRQSASDRQSGYERNRETRRRAEPQRQSEAYSRYGRASTRRYDSSAQDRLSRYR